MDTGKKISNESLLDTLQEKFEKLAEAARKSIANKEQSSNHYYESSTHYFLGSGEENSSGWPREIILPLPKKEWPENFRELEKRYESEMTWPNYSTYLYTMDVFCPPFIPDFLLHFGYAIYQDKLVRCPFFVIFQMTEQTVNEDKVLLPEAFAIDPLAVKNGITPDCYIGINVAKRYVEEWFLSRGRTGHPLENYVKEKNQKEHEDRLYDSYMEAYNLQITHQPGWFPQQLVDFAKREELYIPKQERTDTRLEDQDVKKQISPPTLKEKSKKIFLLRHAQSSVAGENSNLSDNGKQQASTLARKLKSKLDGYDGDITIWTSSASRAKETALIIKESFPNAKFFEYEKLWSDNDHRYDFDWFEEQLEDFKEGALIIITHLEYVQQFPERFGFCENQAGHAEGVLIENNKCIDF